MRPSKKTGRYLATALLVTAVAACIYAWHQSASSPARLLADAYTNQRTLELRIPGAAQAPIRIKRGAGDPTAFDRPTQLMDAEARIAGDLRGRPDDQHLLLLRGQANLLEWSYEAAITDMDRALDVRSDAAGVLDGLAAAYFERAAKEQRFGDYGTAFELQSRALQKSPNDPVIRFNRAITAEKLFLFQQCFADWDRYLELDGQGAWADEARQRYAKTKAFYDAHEARVHAPLLTPAEFAAKIDEADPKTWDRVEPRIEEYLAIATTEWLPQAYPVGGVAAPALAPGRASDAAAPEAAQGERASEARRALIALAAILKTNHGDRWLTEMLAAKPSEAFAEGVKALADGASEVAVGEDFQLAAADADHSSKLFERDGSRAGFDAAEFQQIYALTFKEEHCYRNSEALTARPEMRGYGWLRIQTMLQGTSCAAQQSDLSRVTELPSRAFDQARQSQYPILTQRSVFFLADATESQGHRRQAWDFAGEGLKLYWASEEDSVQGYNLYATMDNLAEDDQVWHLESAASRQAVAILPETARPVLRAVEHMRAARSAVMAGENEAAQKELAQSELLSGSLPRSETTDQYRAGIEMERARLLGAQGAADQGLKRLQRLSVVVAKDQNDPFVRNYFGTLSEIYLRAGQPAEAEAAVANALAISEKQRSFLPSEGERLSWMHQPDSAASYRGMAEVKLARGDLAGALASWEMLSDAATRPPNANSSQAGNLRQQSDTLLLEEEAVIAAKQAALHGATMLIYTEQSRGVGVWVVDQRHIAHVEIDREPADVRLRAQHFTEMCATPASDQEQLKAAAKSLYQLLVAPVSAQLAAGQPLVIEASDTLGAIPFHALMAEDGKYLDQLHPVLRLPAIRLLAEEDEPFAASLRAVMVASPIGDGEAMHPLADAEEEARAVGKHFHSPKLLMDSNAGLGAVSSELASAQVFHFAGHALMRGDGTALVLARSRGAKAELLDAGSVRGMDLTRLRLAVLSACSTGARQKGSTQEMDSLASAFLRAGVPHVLATRWDVDSASSRVLIESFYDELLQGHSVGESLALAESSLRAHQPHPYYWAAFEAFGRN